MSDLPVRVDIEIDPDFLAPGSALEDVSRAFVERVNTCIAGQNWFPTSVTPVNLTLHIQETVEPGSNPSAKWLFCTPMTLIQSWRVDTVHVSAGLGARDVVKSMRDEVLGGQQPRAMPGQVYVPLWTRFLLAPIFLTVATHRVEPRYFKPELVGSLSDLRHRDILQTLSALPKDTDVDPAIGHRFKLIVDRLLADADAAERRAQ